MNQPLGYQPSSIYKTNPKFVEDVAKKGGMIFERETRDVERKKSMAEVRDRIKDLLSLVAYLKINHPEMTFGDRMDRILIKKDDTEEFYKKFTVKIEDLLDFYSTHPTIFQRMVDPETKPNEYEETLTMINIQEMVNNGKLTAYEGQIMVQELINQHHCHKMNKEQYQKFKETGQPPEEFVNTNRAIRLANKLVPNKVFNDAIKKRKEILEQTKKEEEK